jgi:hypothetical protein
MIKKLFGLIKIREAGSERWMTRRQKYFLIYFMVFEEVIFDEVSNVQIRRFQNFNSLTWWRKLKALTFSARFCN